MAPSELHMWVEVAVIVGGLLGVWSRLEITAARHDERLRHVEKNVEDIWQHVNPVKGGHDD